MAFTLPDFGHPILQFITAAVAAVVIGLVAHKLLYRLLSRITRRMGTLHLLVEATDRAGTLFLPSLLLMPVWLGAPEWPLVPVLRHLNGLVLIGAVVWLIIGNIRGGANAIIASKPITVADNLAARRIHTQTRVIARTLQLLVLVIGLAVMLMTFPGVRAVGASLLASAGLIGIVAGVAAQPILSNLIAGLQIALSQPIRIDDVLIVQGEWGRVEEITGTYVVLQIWDSRRLIIPLQWFIQNPFQNWTRTSADLLGTVYLWVDYRMPLAPLRAEALRICQQAEEWDGRLCLGQVTELSEQAMQLRFLVSTADSGKGWDLRCKVREGLIDFMQREYPEALPRQRAEIALDNSAGDDETTKRRDLG